MNKFYSSLELVQNNPLFKKMGEVAPELLINLELTNDSFFELNLNYHFPKKFVLSFNNLERNLISLIETSKKSPLSEHKWLNLAIKSIEEEHGDDLSIHREIRRISTHYKFIVPDDSSIIFGLYRIISDSHLKLKLGMGDFDKSKKTDLEQYLYLDTESIFHKVLFFDELTLIDNNHISINECLGVTRNWYSDISYKHNEKKIKKRINLHKEISKIYEIIFNKIIKSFAQYFNIQHTELPFDNLYEYNFINTLLEVDIYPEMFKKWWSDEKLQPWNYKYLYDYIIKEKIDYRNNLYSHVYSSLINTKEQYLLTLKEYSEISLKSFTGQKNYNQFLNFIYFNHLHFKNCFKNNQIVTEYNIFKNLLQLRKISESYVENIDKNITNFTEKEIESELKKITSIIKNLYHNLNSIPNE